MIQESLSAIGEERCRICLQNEKLICSPCKCRGSLSYIHLQCLNMWLSRVLQRNKSNCQSKGNNRFSIKCQICKGQINFRMTSRKGCRKCTEIKDQIQQDKGKFACHLFSFLIMSTIVSIVFYFSIVSVIESNSSLDIIIFLLFNLILLIIWIRFLHLFFSTYLIGTIYNIEHCQQQ